MNTNQPNQPNYQNPNQKGVNRPGQPGPGNQSHEFQQGQPGRQNPQTQQPGQQTGQTNQQRAKEHGGDASAGEWNRSQQAGKGRANRPAGSELGDIEDPEVDQETARKIEDEEERERNR